MPLLGYCVCKDDKPLHLTPYILQTALRLNSTIRTSLKLHVHGLVTNPTVLLKERNSKCFLFFSFFFFFANALLQISGTMQPANLIS